MLLSFARCLAWCFGLAFVAGAYAVAYAELRRTHDAKIEVDRDGRRSVEAMTLISGDGWREAVWIAAFRPAMWIDARLTGRITSAADPGFRVIEGDAGRRPILLREAGDGEPAAGGR